MLEDKKIYEMLQELNVNVTGRPATPDIMNGLFDIADTLFSTDTGIINYYAKCRNAGIDLDKDHITDYVVSVDMANGKICEIRQATQIHTPDATHHVVPMPAPEQYRAYRYIRPLSFDYQIEKFTLANTGGIGVMFTYNEGDSFIKATFAVCHKDDNFDKDVAKQILAWRENSGKSIRIPIDYITEAFIFSDVYSVKQLFTGNILVNAFINVLLAYKGTYRFKSGNYIVDDVSQTYLRNCITDIIDLNEEMDVLLCQAEREIQNILNGWFDLGEYVDLPKTPAVAKLLDGYLNLF